MVSVRESYETLLMVDEYLENIRRARLPPGATSLDPTPGYANEVQVLWSEPHNGEHRFYCHDDKARLRWRVTPNNNRSSKWPTHVLGVGGWLLRPKNRLLVTASTIHRLAPDAP